MNTNKFAKITSAILLAMLLNNLVNLSSNWYLGLTQPLIYFPLVITGIVGNFYVLSYGAFKLLEKYVEVKV